MKMKLTSIALAMTLGLANISFTTVSELEGKESATITWTGKKVTGEHTGTVQFEKFDWKFDEKGSLISANFFVDMTTIQVTDLEGEMKGKLEGHLSSSDFFNVKEFPTASFETSEVKSLGKGAYEISGNLTIKGITQPLSFNAEINNDGHMKHANAIVVIDRSKFDVRYGSGSFFEGLGDKMIYDEFTLNIKIDKH